MGKMKGSGSKPLRGGRDRQGRRNTRTPRDTAKYYGIIRYFDMGLSVPVGGTLADYWGIRELTYKEFANLHKGLLPDGSPGVQTQNGVHVPVIDVVYVVPKSVDELVLRCDEDLRKLILQAFHDSMMEANELLMEAEVCSVPVGKRSAVGPRIRKLGPHKGEVSKMQGSDHHRVRGLMLNLGPFVGWAARPTDESNARGAPDLFLHGHMPVICVAAVPDESRPDGLRYYSPNDAGIKDQEVQRGMLFLSSFARRLQDLGIPLDFHEDRKGNISWEVAFTDPALRRFLSSNRRRSERIRRDYEEETGKPLSNRDVDRRMSTSRLAKDALTKEFDTHPDFDKVREILEREGFDLSPYPVQEPIALAPFDERVEKLLDRLYEPNGLCREGAAFGESHIPRTIARCSLDLGFTRQEQAELAHKVRAELLEGADGMFTTPRLLETEVEVDQLWDDKAHEVADHMPASEVVEEVIEASADSGKKLDPEQEAGVHAACGPRPLCNNEGPAGAGKTMMEKVVVDAFRAPGGDGLPTADQVFVVSVGAATAERTGRKLEANWWGSIERFKREEALGHIRTTGRSLVIVDEICMVNTFQARDLLLAAGPARIINIGDPGQLTPIGPGGWYARQARKHGVQRITKVYRQKDPRDVEAYMKIHEGRAAEAVADLFSRGRVHISDTPEERIAQVVADSLAWRYKGMRPEDVLAVIDGSNHELDIINRLMQRYRRQRGELGSEMIEVSSIDDERTWRLHKGDLVITLEPYRKGDMRVDNGVSGVILEIDDVRRRATVELTKDHRVVTFELEQEAWRQPLGLAYAVHAAKYQGGENQITLEVPGNERITNANSAYCGITRSMLATHIYLDRQTHGPDPIATIARAWSKPAENRSALSMLQGSDPEPKHLRSTPAAGISEERGPRAAATPTGPGKETGFLRPVSRRAVRSQPSMPPRRARAAIGERPASRLIGDRRSPGVGTRALRQDARRRLVRQVEQRREDFRPLQGVDTPGEAAQASSVMPDVAQVPNRHHVPTQGLASPEHGSRRKAPVKHETFKEKKKRQIADAHQIVKQEQLLGATERDAQETRTSERHEPAPSITEFLGHQGSAGMYRQDPGQRAQGGGRSDGTMGIERRFRPEGGGH